jgi:hypothetical protein
VEPAGYIKFPKQENNRLQCLDFKASCPQMMGARCGFRRHAGWDATNRGEGHYSRKYSHIHKIGRFIFLLNTNFMSFMLLVSRSLISLRNIKNIFGEKKMKTASLLSILLLAFSVNTMFGSSVCPAPYAGNSAGEGVNPAYIANTQLSGTQSSGTVLNNTGCNVLITFGPGGSISTTFPNAAVSYDAGLDDNLVGIINDSGATITAITLSSATYDIFGFDNDGICGTTGGAQTTTNPGYIFVGGGNPCVNSTDPSDYGGPFTLAVATNSNDRVGTVTFGNGGIANGGSSWFSLEDPVDVNLTVAPGTPEPATFSLLGIAACGFFTVLRIRK